MHTSRTLELAWNDTVKAVDDLLSGRYPQGLDAADRTYLLKRSLDHLKTYLLPQLADLREAEAAKAQQDAAKATPAPKAEPECKPCEQQAKAGG